MPNPNDEHVEHDTGFQDDEELLAPEDVSAVIDFLDLAGRDLPQPLASEVT